MKALAMVTALLAGACSAPAHKPTRTRHSPREIVADAKPAIVQIATSDGRVGTGFVLEASGLVATNLHVVAGADEIRVRLLDGAVLPVQRISGLDPGRDLAVLDIDPKAPLPVLALGDSDAVSAGDPVLAIGNPLGVFDYTVSDGLISSVRVVSSELTVIQFSAPISQGSSGGPLFNLFGEVIGIAFQLAGEGQNLNFGIPVNYVKPLLATPKPMSMADFTALTRPKDAGPGQGRKPPPRRVPRHELTVVDGCSKADLAEIAGAISQAIDIGAPLYNQGNHEACFRVYEGTVIKWERDAPCPGVRAAFGDGLLRVSAASNFMDKAWALRDTFDGLLEVFIRHARGP
ncbi:MAG: serine protease [Kofleriaceae bacterium]|nr:serine protease [Kofleriaceae bacterium]